MLVNSPVDSTTLGLGSETVKTLVNYPQTREWQIYFVEPSYLQSFGIFAI